MLDSTITAVKPRIDALHHALRRESPQQQWLSMQHQCRSIAIIPPSQSVNSISQRLDDDLNYNQVGATTKSNLAMSSKSPVPYGRRLLVTQVDHLAKVSPEKIYASYPKSPDLSQGFRDVTYKDLANAVNRGALWLEKTFGGRSTTFDTVAYLGDSDVRYFILILACHKTGHKVRVRKFVSAFRNTHFA